MKSLWSLQFSACQQLCTLLSTLSGSGVFNLNSKKQARILMGYLRCISSQASLNAGEHYGIHNVTDLYLDEFGPKYFTKFV